MPSACGIGGEHIGLDEVTHELHSEQRVAVGLVEKVRRDVLPLLAERVARTSFEEVDERGVVETHDLQVGD